MTYAPARLLELRNYLAPKTGLKSISLGIVGNVAHTKGYHLGKDRIYDGSGPGIGSLDYSVKTARDKNGLTDAASAMDIGNFKQLQELSTFLVSYCRSNKPNSNDIREIIYSPEGKSVWRYDRERGINSVPRPGEADNSHLTHTHISWYRDSQSRDKRAPFIAFFEGEAMKSFWVWEKRTFVTVSSNTRLFTDSSCVADSGTIKLDRATEFVYIGSFDAAIGILAYEPPGPPDANASSKAMFFKKERIITTRSIQDAVPVDVIKAFNDGVTAAAQTALTAKK